MRGRSPLDLFAQRLPGRLIVDSCPWFRGAVFTSGLSRGIPLLHLPILDEVYNRLYGELERGYGAVVIAGKKGVGKSVAAAYALCRLAGGNVSVGSREYRVVVVDVVSGNLDGVKRAVLDMNRLGYIPVFYFDPSPIEAYLDSGRYAPKMSLATAKYILEKLKLTTFSGNAVLLVVASEDQYSVLNVGSVVGVEVRVDNKANPMVLVNFANRRADYLKLSEGLSKLFGDEYYWVAAVVATNMADTDASVEDVLNEVEDVVYGYAADYIWHHVLGSDSLLASYAAPVLLAVGLGLDVSAAMDYVRQLNWSTDHPAFRWAATLQHGLLRSVVEMAAKSAVYMATGLGRDELCQRVRRRQCDLVYPIVSFLKNEYVLKKQRPLWEISTF